jgi:hypothetical protein
MGIKGIKGIQGKRRRPQATRPAGGPPPQTAVRPFGGGGGGLARRAHKGQTWRARMKLSSVRGYPLPVQACVCLIMDLTPRLEDESDRRPSPPWQRQQLQRLQTLRREASNRLLRQGNHAQNHRRLDQGDFHDQGDNIR